VEKEMSRVGGKGAKLSDVAERAGVSKATASNVFNRPHLVRPEVRERVLKEAEAVGYAGPDPMGRLLSAGKVNAIGVATAEPLGYFFEDPFARAMMGGITEACDANGIGISLISAASEDALAWSIKSAVVDGLILLCIEDADRLVAAARERRLPFVTMSFGDTDDEVSVVGVDDVGGARLAAAHLTGLGHRRFAILSMEFGEGNAGRVTMDRVREADYATSRLRVEGYFAALAAAGIDTETVPIFETTSDPATIDAALEELFAGDERPTALLAESDRIAMRALEWLKARGIAVPGEVSVVGFDGVPEGAATDPPLTTVSQPAGRMGRRAVEILVERGEAVTREMLDVEFVARGTTGPPPAS
jgi:DNA-binding LacI/PurR family transcriptional regulator